MDTISHHKYLGYLIMLTFNILSTMTQVILVYADMSVYFYSFLMTSVNFKSKSSFMHIHFTFA